MTVDRGANSFCPGVPMEIDGSYQGPYGPPMNPAAQARFDACWPLEATRRVTFQTLMRHLQQPVSLTGQHHPLPKTFTAIWTWNTTGPFLNRCVVFTEDGKSQSTVGHAVPRLFWQPGSEEWAASIEGKKTLETVHTSLRCGDWSQHMRLAFLAWVHSHAHQPPQAAG